MATVTTETTDCAVEELDHGKVRKSVEVPPAEGT
jgi:hypothetical protein